MGHVRHCRAIRLWLETNGKSKWKNKWKTQNTGLLIQTLTSVTSHSLSSLRNLCHVMVGGWGGGIWRVFANLDSVSLSCLIHLCTWRGNFGHLAAFGKNQFWPKHSVGCTSISFLLGFPFWLSFPFTVKLQTFGLDSYVWWLQPQTLGSPSRDLP